MRESRKMWLKYEQVCQSMRKCDKSSEGVKKAKKLRKSVLKVCLSIQKGSKMCFKYDELCLSMMKYSKRFESVLKVWRRMLKYDEICLSVRNHVYCKYEKIY